MLAGRLFVRAVLVCLLFATPLEAQTTYTLSGTVFGGGSALPNTKVEAMTDGTTAVVAQATTGGSGAYSLTLPDGTYDLRVTPPSGSGFGQETVQNLAISGANRSYDIVLLSAGGSLEGTVRGYGGAPVANAGVWVYTQNWQTIANTTTDANGEYSVPLGGGTVILYVQMPWPPTQNGVAPYFSAYRYSVVINGSTTYDVNLPVVKVSGIVTGPTGAAVPNATVQLDTNSWAPNEQNTSNNTATTTDSNGYYEILGFKAGLHGGSASLIVRPPSNVNLSTISDASLQLTGDTTRNVTLPAPTALTGVVRGHGGAPLANIGLWAYTQNWQTIATTTTDANGQYSLPLGSGTVILYVQTPWPPAVRPAPAYFYAYRYSVTINGPTTFDVNLPVVKISGIVSDSTGSPVPNATVQLDSNSWGPNAQTTSNNTSTATDASGYYEIFGFSAGPHGGSASLVIRPPAGVNAATFSESGIILTGDAVRNITLSPPAFLTGSIRGWGGAPLANVGIWAYTQNWQTIATATTDVNGKYSLSLGAGTVILYLQTPWPPMSNGAAPSYYYAYHYSVAINGDTTYDVTLPVVKIAGAVTDSNGAPVPGVSLQLDSQSWGPNLQYTSNNTTTTTNASGQYEIFGFAKGLHGGNATLTVRPPASSGFSTASISGLAMTGDLTQRIILQRPDLSPPQIVAGPVVVHLSDDSVSVSWTTNEAANSRVDYGIGSLASTISDSAMTTNHTMTLLNLTPLSIYSFKVGSADAAGNGPVFSPVGTFTTQGPPGDITPPVISAGPTVVFVDQTTAIIEWTTDEPAAPVLSYGLTADLGSTIPGPAGKFTETHSMKLTGLSAETRYYAQAASTDPDGNSIASSIFSFSTLAVPDTSAPLVTSGPTISSKTDTKITVAWTTNEPATSGVSYNDGTRFFVVSDAALTREHEITLSDLSPQTVYYITVSSTDAVGNGPALAGPVEAATDETPDTTAPSISNLQVVDISETSAVVTWTTDERSTSSVSFGIVSGAPDNVKADVSGATEHRITLTGLADGTKYYVTVASTDVSGNAATSDEVAFKTVSAFIDMPPSAPGPITGPSGPTRAASFDLVWGASTDDIAVTGYEVLRDGQVVVSVAGDVTSHTESGLAEGSYTYQIRAADSAGHTAVSATLAVIIDRTAPRLALPADQVLEAAGPSGAVATFAVSADDLRDGALTATCSHEPGSSFPVGTTAVLCSAVDAAGNVAAGEFLITVADTQAPRISSVVPDHVELWPANHQMVPVAITVTAADIVDAAPVCRIVQVSSNEPENGLGDGDTPTDWVIDDALVVRLRAERSGQGTGRTYTIAIECRDASGNRATGETSVFVPHSRAKK